MRWMGRNSLKSILVTRFALVLALLLVVINAGFLIFITTVTPDTNSVDEASLPVITEALTKVDNRMEVRTTERFSRLLDTYPSIWFVAVDADGREIAYGSVPALFSSVIDKIGEVRSLDLRGDEGSVVTAKVTRAHATFGEVKVLYGGNAVPGNPVVVLFWGARVMYVPLIVLPVFGVFLCLPVLVGRALSGLKKTTATAASIDTTSLGVRLSKEGVVEELHPLVTAINAALSRIDDDFNKRQRFFANAAHELRTPIAILQTRLEGLEPGTQRERLLRDVARLAAMAEQLLDMQRLSTVQNWEDIDLVVLCETVAADCGPLAISEGYDLEFTAEVASFVFKGDQSSLERAITNLIRNAIEHGGGVGTIRVEVLRDGTIEVADEGPGISKDEFGKVFEPFYRTKPKSTGAGLGLSIVKEIVRAHSGRISIVEQERGACFRLKLGLSK